MTYFELVLMGITDNGDHSPEEVIATIDQHLPEQSARTEEIFKTLPCQLARLTDETAAEKACLALREVGAKVVVIEREEPSDPASESNREAFPGDPEPSAPSKEATMFHAGVQAMQRGDKTSAEQMFLRVLLDNPRLYEAHVNLGNLYFETQRFENAIASYEQAVRSNPNRVDGHFNLANTLAKVGRLDEAIRSYKEALQVEPDHIGTRQNIEIYRKKRFEAYNGNPPPEPEAERRLYKPNIFFRDDLEKAKRIILTPEQGRDASARWEIETPAMVECIINQLAPSSESLILDFGCGIGRISKELIAQSGCRVIGADISADMLRHAFPYVENQRFSGTFVDQLESLATHGCRVDHAVAIWVLQHVESPSVEIERIARLIKPGGLFFVANAHKRYVPTEQGWLHDKQDVDGLIKKHFSEVRPVSISDSMLPQHLIDQHWCKLYRRMEMM